MVDNSHLQIIGTSSNSSSSNPKVIFVNPVTRKRQKYLVSLHLPTSILKFFNLYFCVGYSSLMLCSESLNWLFSVMWRIFLEMVTMTGLHCPVLTSLWWQELLHQPDLPDPIMALMIRLIRSLWTVPLSQNFTIVERILNTKYIQVNVCVVVWKDWKCLHVTELFQSLLYTLNLAWKEAIEQNIRTAPGQISSDSACLFLF